MACPYFGPWWQYLRLQTLRAHVLDGSHYIVAFHGLSRGDEPVFL
jgi:hypothetical protein